MGITGERRTVAACRQALGPTIRVFSTHSDIYTVDIYTKHRMIKAPKLTHCAMQGQNGKPTHIAYKRGKGCQSIK